MLKSNTSVLPVSRASFVTCWRMHLSRLLIVLGLIFTTTAVLAQGTALDQARKFLTAGDPQAAYDVLKPLESARAGEPEFDYLLGISALDTDRNTEAVFALERVLAVNPGDALARAEIARAYLKLGEFNTAQRELDQIRRRTDIPTAAQQAIDNYLATFRTTAAGRTEWRGYIAAVLGYDSNVNSATSETSFGIGGLTFVLALGASEQSDRFMQLRSGVSVVSPLGQGLSLLGGVDGDSRWNEDLRSLDQANLSGYAGANKELGLWNLSGVFQYAQFRLDRESFRNAIGATVQARRALGQSGQITGYAQLHRLSYLQQGVRDAYRSVLGTAYTRAFAGDLEPILFAGALVAWENVIDSTANNGANVEHLGHFAYGANVGGRLTFNKRTRLFANVSVEQRNYGGREPIFGIGRNDTQYDFKLGLDYMPARRWTITPAINHTRNISNIAINDHSRTEISVMIRRDFGN